MNATSDFPASKDDLLQAFDEVASFKPERASWGFFFRDDPPPPACGGGMFCWFADKRELCAFLERFPLMCASDFEAEDDAELAESVQAAVEEIRSLVRTFREAGANTEATRLELNAALGSFGEFKWFGTLDMLMMGDDQFALDVRHGFWWEYAPESSPEFGAVITTQIPIKLQKEFLEFTRYYGC